MRPSRLVVCVLHVVLLLGSPKPSHQSPDSTGSSSRRLTSPDVTIEHAAQVGERREAASTTGREAKEEQSLYRKWARSILSRSDRWRRGPYRRNLFRWVRANPNEARACDGDRGIATRRERRPPPPLRDHPQSTGSDCVEHATDSAVRGIVQRLGWVVAAQTVVTLLTANSNQLLHEIMSQLLSEETAAAFRKIREILVKAYDDGLADVFTKNRPSELWTSIYAWSRLQNAAFRYDTIHKGLPARHGKGNSTTNRDPAVDAELLADLARYAVYANAAYGSMMDVAFGGGFHLRDNLQNLLLRTRTPKGDVIAVQRDARRHPAYFLLRDRVRKRIVLCLRGTWTAHDVLNDLCCEADDLRVPDKPSSASYHYYRRRGSSRHVRAHHGMLLAAKVIQEELQPVLEAEFEERPDYSLVLAGHSMGGGVAALLGILWEHNFPGVCVYAFGAPCVTSIEANAKPIPVISVLHELDPFSRMSLGHVADVSIGIGLMCDDLDLRSQVIERTSRPFDEMPLADLKWCSETMSRLRSAHLKSEKLYPPGRILLLEGTTNRSARRGNSLSTALREAQPEYFQDLLIRPRVFDLTRHAPASYVHWLRQLVDRSRQQASTKHGPNCR